MYVLVLSSGDCSSCLDFVSFFTCLFSFIPRFMCSSFMVKLECVGGKLQFVKFGSRSEMCWLCNYSSCFDFVSFFPFLFSFIPKFMCSSFKFRLECKVRFGLELEMCWLCNYSSCLSFVSFFTFLFSFIP